MLPLTMFRNICQLEKNTPVEFDNLQQKRVSFKKSIGN